MWSPFKRKISGPELTFLPSGKKVTVLPGTSVLEAATLHKVDLNHSCDGNLACSSCHIYVHAGAESAMPPSGDEDEMLDAAEDVLPNSRLGCQLKVYENMTVEIPPSS
ncbi:ferredoxin, 2Fe-2S [Mariprofundus aestuarium]|uniref:Ferredoxin, 2Fe-2S n=2 Tax=Mariprofundus aestuarium TaxID=1921086 RepID=A0A2K8KZE7_MARES|nr:ferredoxin, 2Fe-2S [Mariprofundus aestuarium]